MLAALFHEFGCASLIFLKWVWVGSKLRTEALQIFVVKRKKGPDESDICEGRPLGGLYNTASTFYAHSMASHLRANRIHWLGFQFNIQPFESPIPKMWFSSLLSAENCSGFSHPSLRKTAYDLDCRQKHSTVCQGSISLLKIFRWWENPLSRTQCLNFGWGGSALLLHLTPCTSCARIWVR